MKKVLLFSPNGYVGKYLSKKIKENIGISLYEITRTSNLEDFTDNYDILIYSASVTSSRNEKIEKYVVDNVLAAIKMMEFCKMHKVSRIIYLSSDEVYGQLNTDVVTEESLMVSPNIYGTTKYLAERVIKESGIQYFIIRLPAIVGKSWGKSFIYKIFEKAGKNEDIIIYNGEKSFNNLIEIDDLVNFIIKLVMINDKSDSEVFTIGNIKKMKLIEIIEYIKLLCGSNSKIINKDFSKQRYFVLSVEKAIKFGYISKEIKVILDDLYLIAKKEGIMSAK